MTDDNSQPTDNQTHGKPLNVDQILSSDDELNPRANETRNQFWERLRKTARANGQPKREAYQWANEQTETRWARHVELLEAAKLASEDDEAEQQDVCSDATNANDDKQDSKDEQEATKGGREAVGDAVNLPASAELTTVSQSSPVEPTPRARDGESSVTGLNAIPDNWPTLPANANLAVEIQWVQANRMRCVTDRGDSVSVDLSQAMTPAPSWAALSWLETSIRAYTKFVDVAAKATSQLEDEREHVRRERLAIEEVRSLLAEMLESE